MWTPKLLIRIVILFVVTWIKVGIFFNSSESLQLVHMTILMHVLGINKLFAVMLLILLLELVFLLFQCFSILCNKFYFGVELSDLLLFLFLSSQRFSLNGSASSHWT